MNGICILCNDVKRLKISSSNFPENINNYKLFIINDTRLGDKTKEFKAIVPTAEIIPSDKLFDLFEDCANVLRYPLSAKLIGPWYIYQKYSEIDKLLFLDDDVIITERIDKIFSYRIGGVVMFTISSKHGQYKVLTEAFKCFGIAPDESENRVVGGQLLFNKNIIDMDEYRDSLRCYFASEIFTSEVDFIIKRNNFRHGNLDEVFHTAMYKRYKDSFDSLNKDACQLVQRPLKYDVKYIRNQLSRKSLLHVMISKDKMSIFDNLIEKGVLKYED